MRHSFTAVLTLTLVACATATETFTFNPQEIRDVVRAEVMSVLSDLKVTDKISQSTKDAAKEKAKIAANFGVAKANSALDQAQSDLDIYGEEDAGVWNVIPQSYRDETEWVVNLAKDPANAIIDSKQAAINSKINETLTNLVQQIESIRAQVSVDAEVTPKEVALKAAKAATPYANDAIDKAQEYVTAKIENAAQVATPKARSVIQRALRQ